MKIEKIYTRFSVYHTGINTPQYLESKIVDRCHEKIIAVVVKDINMANLICDLLNKNELNVGSYNVK